ncbi:MAG: U3 snoRNP protein [Caeruleum heppii]|nr:MAG: U3 snoRNP protein [Caeruleum heppii]
MSTSKIRKGGTASTKHHRFQPFSHRVAKLKIDPVRRSRRNVGQEEDPSTVFSFFKASLDDWVDLNTSATFTAFTRQVAPLCDSLPQVLHFEARIVDLLVLFIEKRDALSLEPLLALVARLAHDLGARFERHFSRVVALVASLAASDPDIEVIEWSFNCLTWLFKYLSRLLLPDLRPTYTLLAPLLGKQRQKPFVTRFAAEAMSFLVRKAALAYHRDPEPLQRLTSHVCQDLVTCEAGSTSKQYQEGIMTLFAEAVKGVDRTLSSAAHLILRRLLHCISDLASGWTMCHQVLTGVLINTIHHSDAENFLPLADEITEFAYASTDSPERLYLASRLLFVIAATRKGSRISNWSALLDSFKRLLDAVDHSSILHDSGRIDEMLATVAVLLHLSPMDNVISFVRPVMTMVAKRHEEFLTFCNFFAGLDPTRFRGFILPYLQSFIANHWQSFAKTLSSLVPEFYRQGCFAGPSSGSQTLTVPIDWQEQMITLFSELASSEQSPVTGLSQPSADLTLALGHLELLECMSHLPTTRAAVAESLHQLLQRCLDPNSDQDHGMKELVFGRGFLFYVDSYNDATGLDVSLWPSLRFTRDQWACRPTFLTALQSYIEQLSSVLDLEAETLEPIIDALVDNLSSCSSSLRLPSLAILQALHKMTYSHPADVLTTAALLEEMTPNLETMRTASMRVRSLAAAYPEVVQHPWLKRMVPRFCFGLLTIQLSQIREDACAALGAIASFQEAEEEVLTVCLHWLEAPHILEESSTVTTEQQSSVARATAFQCSNVLSLESTLKDCVRGIQQASNDLHRRLFNGDRPTSPVSPTARFQALQVLRATAQLAEKRSRTFVPIFLQWAGEAIDGAVEEPAAESIVESDMVPSDSSSRWTRKEQKEMLKLFAQFTNPRVLYEADKVYAALLNLLTNGDLEVQKAALEAIFTWKTPSIVLYQDNLRNLLDPARFSEQITDFVQDNGESGIQTGHRHDLVPLLLRLLYGRMVAWKGAGSGKRTPEAKRKMVLKALSEFPDSEFEIFIQVALGPLYDLSLYDEVINVATKSVTTLISARKQVGLLHMIEDMTGELGSRLLPFTAKLVEAILFAMIQASRMGAEALKDSKDSVVFKNIRHLGLRCLNLLFSSCSEFDWHPYRSLIIEHIVSPRLDRLPIETAQAPSGLLQLFLTWAQHEGTVYFLVERGQRILLKIAECLSVASATEEVQLHVLSIIGSVVSLSGDAAELSEGSRARIRSEILQPNLDGFLTRIEELLHGSPSRDLLDVAVQTMRRLAPFVLCSPEASNIVRTSTFLLNQPLRRVSPKTKSALLHVLQQFLSLVRFDHDRDLEQEVFKTISALFGFFRDRSSREALSQAFKVYAQQQDDELARVAELCDDLNSFSTRKIEEPDFDRRLAAFNIINEVTYRDLSARQWTPLLHNMLFFIKDGEELAIRNNSSYAMRRFADRASTESDPETIAEFQSLLKAILIPAIQKGAHEPSELVRVEYLAVMSHLIKAFPSHPELADMEVLLVGEDDEASFFTNVLHIQQHRRLRALRRLAHESQAGHIRSGNLSHFFIPLIEHFIFSPAEDGHAHSLAAEAVSTVGALLEWIQWPQFRALFRRILGSFEATSDPQRVVIRLLGAASDALARASANKKQRAAEPVLNSNEMKIDSDASVADHANSSTLSLTMPKDDKLATELTTHFLPAMTNFLHHKDETIVGLRTPIGVAAVKLLKLLPNDQLTDRLPLVLTDICNILRSRSQDARDVTRKTLAEITATLGPECFGFVLAELRGALTRGYQLHVLSFTVHSILVANTDNFGPGDIDYCVPQIVGIIMDDIFGATGQEKDAEEYVSKMKEVKSSKSFDSMELLAKTVTLSCVSDLVKPVQAILREKINLRMLKKIDELLRRIGVGLLRNEAAHDQRTLVFCYELMQNHYTAQNAATTNGKQEDYSVQRYLVNLKGARGVQRGSGSNHTHKTVRFALDMLRGVLHRYPDLQTPSNLAAFLPILGDALVESQEEVQLSAIRLLTAIVKTPRLGLNQNAELYILEAVKIIKAAPSTNTELSQASLKLVSALLRERQTVALDEAKLHSRMAFLLKRISQDMEEPDRQGVTFNFVKALITREVLIPEVYDVMDKVAAIMVTNHTQTVRDLARGVYFQFLMEYPQGEKRFAKQLSFLVKNLQYQYPEGRRSVLEVVHLLLAKVGDQLAKQVMDNFMLPLVMVLVNDEAEDCREMAAVLLRELLGRADGQQSRTFLSMIHSWLEQDGEALLKRAALQCYGLYIDVHGDKAAKQAKLLRSCLLQILEPPSASDSSGDWETQYLALQSFLKLCQVFPSTTFGTESASLWSAVQRCLSFPHAWVKLSAARLIGLFLADFARTNAGTDLGQLPLKGSHGLQLEAKDLVQLMKRSIGTLRVAGVGEQLAVQAGRNLVFLGRCLGAAGTTLEPVDALGNGAVIEAVHAAATDSDNEDGPESGKNALRYLFERIWSVLRREPGTMRAVSLVAKTACLQLVAALCNHLSTDILRPCVTTVLLPLHNLTDPNIPAPYSSDMMFMTAYKDLQSTSHEIMSLLQKKFGTTEYVTHFAQVQKEVRDRREGRRVKRRIEAITAPEITLRDKRRKEERKKSKRKERSMEERGKRRGW